MRPNFAKRRLVAALLLSLSLFWLVFSAGCSLAQPPSALPGARGASPAVAFGGPDPRSTAQAYLEAWKVGDFQKMYGLLTSISRDAISEEEFLGHYQSIAKEAALSSVGYEILSSLTNPETAQVGYRVKLVSELVGEIQADTLMNLSMEDGGWRVQWDDALVLPQLKGEHYLSMQRGGYTPARANIYDRHGQALVAQTDVTAIGLIPDQIDPAQADTLLAAIAELTGLSPAQVQAMYAGFPAGAGWYLPLGQVPVDQVASRYDFLSTLRGLVLSPYKARYYFDGGVAPHVIGYMGTIPAEETEEYTRKGYQPDDRVGRSGLERWGEPYLAGKRGGALYVLDAQGQPVTRLAETQAQPAQAIYTTLDRDLQLGAEQALAGFRGAAVVLERDTGRVLAMVSSPDFDPNAFEPVNFNSDALLNALQGLDQPLVNRATQGQYPLGSVFKIISMAAALESGLYTPESVYFCGHTFTELEGATLHDWTYEYGFPPSGLLTLPQGLIRSCNPFFYHIGLDLYNQGLTTAITDMASGFGLGSPTGIAEIDESAGQAPVPETQFDATNQAIGQGALLVTPLQVARFIAAIGNGGTLYQPQVVELVKAPDGEPIQLFKPQAVGKLPVTPETLRVIQEALVGVVSSAKPRGTAYHVFSGLDLPVAGKTGTAQSGSGAPHAWFAGYTFAERPEHPDIAVVVIAENAGEGSDIAAPIFRRIVELYFQGVPGKLYDWEATYNVTRTPAPQESTPAP